MVINFYAMITRVVFLSHKMNKQQTNNPANDQSAKWENGEKTLPS